MGQSGLGRAEEGAVVGGFTTGADVDAVGAGGGFSFASLLGVMISAERSICLCEDPAAARSSFDEEIVPVDLGGCFAMRNPVVISASDAFGPVIAFVVLGRLRAGSSSLLALTKGFLFPFVFVATVLTRVGVWGIRAVSRIVLDFLLDLIPPFRVCSVFCGCHEVEVVHIQRVLFSTWEKFSSQDAVVLEHGGPSVFANLSTKVILLVELGPALCGVGETLLHRGKLPVYSTFPCQIVHVFLLRERVNLCVVQDTMRVTSKAGGW